MNPHLSHAKRLTAIAGLLAVLWGASLPVAAAWPDGMRHSETASGWFVAAGQPISPFLKPIGEALLGLSVHEGPAGGVVRDAPGDAFLRKPAGRGGCRVAMPPEVRPMPCVVLRL